jgi:hypothetical protein
MSIFSKVIDKTPVEPTVVGEMTAGPVESLEGVIDDTPQEPNIVGELVAGPVDEEQKEPTEEVGDEYIPTEFFFRKLQARDIMPVVKIIQKIGIKQFIESLPDEMLKTFLGSTDEEKAETETEEENLTDEEKAETEKLEKAKKNKAGIEFMLSVADTVINNLSIVENDVFEFLGSVTEKCNAEDIKNLELNQFVDLIYGFIQKEDFASFIKAVSRFLK